RPRTVVLVMLSLLVNALQRRRATRAPAVPAPASRRFERSRQKSSGMLPVHVPISCQGFPPAKLIPAESLHLAVDASGGDWLKVRVETPVLGALLHGFPLECRYASSLNPLKWKVKLEARDAAS